MPRASLDGLRATARWSSRVGGKWKPASRDGLTRSRVNLPRDDRHPGGSQSLSSKRRNGDGDLFSRFYCTFCNRSLRILIPQHSANPQFRDSLSPEFPGRPERPERIAQDDGNRRIAEK